MSAPTIPVSMIAGSGKGSALAAGVVGLLILLALASRRDPTAHDQTKPQVF